MFPYVCLVLFNFRKDLDVFHSSDDERNKIEDVLKAYEPASKK